VLLGSLTVWRLSRDAATDEHTFVGETMGTSYHVTVDAELSTRDQGAVREVIAARLERVNRLMSTYDSTSELSRLNRHDGPEPFPVSRELLEVLTMAREVSERSGGAFDVTVAPLVEAWGFGPAGRPARRPEDRELVALSARVGYTRIRLDHSASTVSKTAPETVIDLSAIAKGYGVESVASGLRGLGLTRFLVEVGGEVKAVGTRSDGRAWRVGIESPDEAVRSVHGVVGLTDEALATSGDYRNFYEEDGVRYAHVIDPRTGSPVRYHGSSVSVAHPNAAKADAWATALTVLGPDAGYDLARREDVAALFVMRANGEFQSRATPLFSERLEVSEKAVR
jgi:thiamine biosynthesis lipoprotein